MPILANEQAVPGMDPYEISTWRTELSMEESGKLMRLAEVGVAYRSTYINFV